MFGHSHSHSHAHSHSLLVDDDEAKTHHRRTANLKRLLKLAAPEKYFLVVGVVSLLVSAGVNLFIPLAMADISSSGSLEKATDTLKVLIPIFVGGVCFTCMRGFLFTLAGERIIKRLRMQLFTSITSQEIAFFDENKTGDLINRLTSDTTLMQTAATLTSAMILRFGIQIIGGSIILLVISWKLTFVMLIPIPVGAVAAYFIGRWMKRISKMVQDALASTTAIAEESISHIRCVRAFANEKVECNRYKSRIDVSFRLGRKMARVYCAIQGGAELATYTIILLVVWYGSVLMISDELDQTTLTSFLLYALTVAHAIGALSNHLGDMTRAVGASERVFEIIDRQPSMNISGGRAPPSISGRVAFNHVSFAYPARKDKVILSDFSLNLEPGQVVGVVGMSGSGKTTLTQLLLRLYEVDGGNITIDGTDIRELDPKWLRDSIGFVGQEPVLFNMSVLDNILYGRPNSSLSEVYDAAKQAYIHDFVTSLSDGYDTMCGEKGAHMSGGQKQRITIARALVKNPRILIFDEATSALDSENEQMVQKAMEEVVVGRTVLIIAHRISTIRNAQIIVVMQNGKIVEMGPHGELMAKQGFYEKLVAAQMQKMPEL
eukprot:Phypoly_transcript_05567.p1 GENE.Phypoly_transcript_05567~~Phypoly_transcript_05567.p1  ORF type:complete len:604 (+),score=103.38 Phypoly_transcript_05567:30-1841(+)